MKVLVVCSFNSGKISPFVEEQTNWLSNSGIHTRYFLIKRKGLAGYLSQLPLLKKEIKQFQPDLIHAHYGLTGVLANLQFKVPVVTTFHGSDINYFRNRIISRMAIKYSAWSVFVSEKLSRLAGVKKNFSVISCGIDTTVFHPENKTTAREKMGFYREENLVLFSGSFSDQVKNYPLAKKAITRINSEGIIHPPMKLVELKNYSRMQVNLLLNACDVALLTSFSEGSPNFIKEALACNRPIVATDSGDIREMVGKTDGCYIASYNLEDITNKIKLAFAFGNEHSSTQGGRNRISELNLETDKANKKLLEIFENLVNHN